MEYRIFVVFKFPAVRFTLLWVCALFLLPLFLFGGFLKRDETQKFQRDNPSDQRANNYQGYVAQDLDGDGLADFIITLNSGVTDTTSPLLNFEIRGPAYRKAWVSETSNLASPVLLSGDFQGSYYLISGYGDKWLYFKFEFANGLVTPLYSNFISYHPPYREEDWLAGSVSYSFAQPPNCVTNSNVTMSLSAPYGSVQFRSSDNSNQLGAWKAWANSFQILLTNGLGTNTNQTLYFQIKSQTGSTRSFSTNFLFFDWRGFGINFNTNATVVTGTNGEVYVSNSLVLTRMRLANDPNFVGGTAPWMPANSSTSWALSNGPGVKVVYCIGTNDVLGLSTPTVSVSLMPLAITPGNVVINGGTNTALTPELSIQLSAANAQWLRAATSTLFLDGLPYSPYQSTLTFSLPTNGSTNRRDVYLQYSNEFWKTECAPINGAVVPPSVVSLMNPFVAQIESNAATVTNTNLLISLNMSNVDFVRFSAWADFSAATPMVPYQENLTYHYLGTGTSNPLAVYVQGSNAAWGFARQGTNYFPGTGSTPFWFTNNLTNGCVVSSNIVLLIYATNASHMRFSTNANFVNGTGWLAYGTNFLWEIDEVNYPKKYSIFAQVSNSQWDQLSGVVSRNFYKAVPGTPFVYFTNNQLFIPESSATLFVLATNGTHVRISSNDDFSTGTGWIAQTTNVTWDLYAGGPGVTNWVYVQSSNSDWGRVSPIVTNKAIVMTNWYFTNSFGMVFANLPGGWFTQGDSSLAPPVQNHFLSPFSMAIGELNYSNWLRVYNWAVTNGFNFYPLVAKGSLDGGDSRQPAVKVSFCDAASFCNALSQMEGRPFCYFNDAAMTIPYKGNYSSSTNIVVAWRTNGYRLPSESEWEYACRGGTSTASFFPIGEEKGYGWYSGNTANTHVTGEKWANPFGLFDMVGNASEWCFDTYTSSYGSDYINTISDPVAPQTTSYLKVIRGGAWANGSSYLASSFRPAGAEARNNVNTIGFRLVLPNP